MISRPFLTAPDTDRLDIRGSRDPLGIAVLWSHVGRHVVGNLTTASASVRGFTSTMLGYHFAEELAPHDRDRESFRLKAFLKFEQLCAYARVRYNSDGNLRGIRDVRMKLATGRPITISADSAGQILANQKVYGLWGLYSVPSKASDLVSDSLALTSRATNFLERESLRAIRKKCIQAQIARILTADKTRVEPDGKDAQLFQALAAALSTTYSAADRDFYHRHLVIGEYGKCRLQPVFAELMESVLQAGAEFSLDSLKLCIAEANRRKLDDLEFRLRNIQHLEAVQVPMAMLFAFAQARDGAPFETVAKEVTAAWGSGLKHVHTSTIDEMQKEISGVFGNASVGALFSEFAHCIHRGDFHQALTLVVSHNEFVMRERGGAAPWIVVQKGKLDVRYRDSQLEGLPTPRELANTWRNSFYIDPLKAVIDQLRVA